MKAAEYRRELGVAACLALLLMVVGLLAPRFYSVDNLRDLLLRNALILIPAVAMTFVIVAREIDISIGSQFALLGIVAGLLGRQGLPIGVVLPAALLVGALLGGLQGGLVAFGGIPSIIVTLAGMVSLRGALRWATQGAYVEDLPPTFQWLGLGQAGGQVAIVLLAGLVFAAAWWAGRHLAAGRAVYAVGCDAEAARLAGLRPKAVICGTFVLLGMATALAATLSAARFADVPSNTGLGLELQVIAAVVVGGAAITGGRGTMLGTLLGTLLLGCIGTVLTFLKIDPAWERAVAGAIILVAVSADSLAGQRSAS